ncbi:MAG: putative ABC transporter ATP-binding protein [Candidatus Heimdallarchaeota archaeon LC_3]|nr:MAG: putative ABC transporter ATP-binding protein [Candidatus Heimdallarchaeota archaeon LC_3]
MVMSKSYIELKDVIKLYETDIKTIKVAALRGLELSLNQGDLVAVIGPSGSGKTTLIKMLGGIEVPSSGEVRVDNQIINSLKRRQLVKYRRYDVGFMWQLPEKNLLPRLSSLKNVMMPMQIAHVGSRQERIKRANELLDAVGLSSRKNQSANKLSGGEAQRVALAVSLSNKPKLVLADEPTGELDSLNAAKIIEYIKELNKELGQTFIVVTHDNRFASMTDLTYKIRDGTIYGIHRKFLNGKKTTSIYDREHLGTLDSFGTLRLPDDLITKANLKLYVRFEFNKDKKCIEIHPVSDKIEEGS